MRPIRRAIARLTAAALLFCGLCASFSAGANGRYPSADQLVVDPGDANHLVVRATFGVLQTWDGGKSWSWICEGAVGYGSAEDPSLAVMKDGSVVAGSYEGLAVSHDKSCSWSAPPGDILGRYVIDIATERGDPSHAVVATGGDLDGGYGALVLATTDDAASFAPLGIPLPSDFTPVTIDVAPSRLSEGGADPQSERIYLSGSNKVASAIERSDDRGQSWETLPVSPYGEKPGFIAAIDPGDPQKLYLRVEDAPADHLLFSSDGAASWKNVFSLPGDMLGFALSPDGTRVAVGGPGAGVYVASTADFRFKKMAAPVLGLRCLTWGAAGLYACSKKATDGWTVALSADEGQSFTPLLLLSNLSPLACGPETSVGSTCPAAWPPVEKQLATADSDAGPDARPDAAPEAGPDAAPDTEMPTDAPASPTDIDPSEASEPPGAGEPSPGGCACRVRQRGDTKPFVLLCIAWGFAWLARSFGCRRDRRRESKDSWRRSSTRSIPTATSS